MLVALFRGWDESSKFLLDALWLLAAVGHEFSHFLLSLLVALHSIRTLLYATINLQSDLNHGDLIQMTEIKHSAGLLLASLCWMSPFTNLRGKLLFL